MLNQNLQETPSFFGPHDFLARLSQRDLADLKRLAKSRAVSKNNYVFREGDTDTDIYVLEQGRIKIYQSSPQGKDILLWFLLDGDIFALNGLFQRKTHAKRICYALASEDSKVLAIPREAFKAHLATHPNVAEVVMEICLLRLDCLRNRLLILACDDVEHRLKKLLDCLCRLYGVNLGNGHTRINIPLTHQEIANIIGTSRQTTSTLLAQFKSQGLVNADKKNLIINTNRKSELGNFSDITSSL